MLSAKCFHNENCISGGNLILNLIYKQKKTFCTANLILPFFLQLFRGICANIRLRKAGIGLPRVFFRFANFYEWKIQPFWREKLPRRGFDSGICDLKMINIWGIFFLLSEDLKCQQVISGLRFGVAVSRSVKNHSKLKYFYWWSSCCFEMLEKFGSIFKFPKRAIGISPLYEISFVF